VLAAGSKRSTFALVSALVLAAFAAGFFVNAAVVVRADYLAYLGPVVIRPILSPIISVNHSAPSGPGTMRPGIISGFGTGYWVIAPLVALHRDYDSLVVSG
jgi:hypothetical protein